MSLSKNIALNSLIICVMLTACATAPRTPWGHDDALYQRAFIKQASELGVSAQDPQYKESFDKCAIEVSDQAEETVRAVKQVFAKAGYRSTRVINDLAFNTSFNKFQKTCISQDMKP